MAHLSQRQAASKWCMSRATLQRAIKAGKLSLTPDKTIDPAEMLRAFGEPKPALGRENGPEKPTPVTGENGDPLDFYRHNYELMLAERDMLRELVRSKDETLASMDANLADMRNQVLRLTYETGPARRRHWWPWGKA